MKIAAALQGVTRLFLDTAPVIYYVEKNPRYLALTTAIFQQIDAGTITAVTSPITLAESLVGPYRTGSPELQRDFSDLILKGRNTVFAPIEREYAAQAAQLRAQHNLALLDAFQVTVALNAGCEALLTNDSVFRRVSGLSILILDDLEL